MINAVDEEISTVSGESAGIAAETQLDFSVYAETYALVYKSVHASVGAMGRRELNEAIFREVMPA